MPSHLCFLFRLKASAGILRAVLIEIGRVEVYLPWYPQLPAVGTAQPPIPNALMSTALPYVLGYENPAVGASEGGVAYVTGRKSMPCQNNWGRQLHLAGLWPGDRIENDQERGRS